MANFIIEKINEKRRLIAQEKYEKKYDVLYKRYKGEKVLFIIMFIIFVLFAVSFIFPFMWLCMNAFKEQGEFAKDFMSLPSTWVWDNFINAFTFKNTATKNFNVFQFPRCVRHSAVLSGLQRKL